jgi:RsiW-degrading membrane proteinase PrsW (M82 family)
MRFAVLYYVGMRWIGFTRPRDGLVFGVLVSLGFSCAENIFYAVSIGWATGLLKLTIATPIHLALGVIMGSLLAVAAGSPSKRRSYTAYALAAPVLLHGTYDLVLLTALADGGAGAFARLALPVTCYLLVGATAVLTVLRSRQASASAA